MLKNRRKGYTGEKAFEKFLKSLGLDAKRIPRSGHYAHRGDVEINTAFGILVAEVKSWANDFPEYKILEKSEIYAKRTIRVGKKGDWIITMSGETLKSLLALKIVGL